MFYALTYLFGMVVIGLCLNIILKKRQCIAAAFYSHIGAVCSVSPRTVYGGEDSFCGTVAQIDIFNDVCAVV